MMGGGRCGEVPAAMAFSVLAIWRMGAKRMGQNGRNWRDEGPKGLVPLALCRLCPGASVGARHGTVQSTFAGWASGWREVM